MLARPWPLILTYQGHTKIHFEKFCNLDFRIAPKGEGPWLMWDLLEFESILLFIS